MTVQPIADRVRSNSGTRAPKVRFFRPPACHDEKSVIRIVEQREQRVRRPGVAEVRQVEAIPDGHEQRVVDPGTALLTGLPCLPWMAGRSKGSAVSAGCGARLIAQGKRLDTICHVNQPLDTTAAAEFLQLRRNPG
jgi:hypothetical protein